MKQLDDIHIMSSEEIIADAIRREEQLVEYYRIAVNHVGPDAYGLFASLYAQQREHITKLELMLKEINDLRELAVGIAD